MRVFIEKVETEPYNMKDPDGLVGEYFTFGKLESGQKILFDMEQYWFDLRDFQGKWIECLIYVGEGSNSAKKNISGIFSRNLPSSLLESEKYISYTGYNPDYTLKDSLEKFCGIQTEDGNFIISCGKNLKNGRMTTYKVGAFSIFRWYPLNGKLLNPKYDMTVFRKLREFLSVIDKELEGLSRLNEGLEIEQIIQNQFILSKKIDNPFSDSLLDYIRRKFLEYELEQGFYSKLTKKNFQYLIQYSVDYVIYILLDMMDKDPSIRLADIEIDSEKYP